MKRRRFGSSAGSSGSRWEPSLIGRLNSHDVVAVAGIGGADGRS